VTLCHRHEGEALVLYVFISMLSSILSSENYDDNDDDDDI